MYIPYLSGDTHNCVNLDIYCPVMFPLVQIQVASASGLPVGTDRDFPDFFDGEEPGGCHPQ